MIKYLPLHSDLRGTIKKLYNEKNIPALQQEKAQ
jgi:hypothetical protein